MFKAFISALIVWGACCIASGAEAASSSKLRSVARTLQAGDLQRNYRLYVPPSLPTSPAPLVIVLHGGGGGATGVELLTRFSDMADRGGFIVAYPEGYKKNWNDGRVIKGSKPHSEKIDDVAFIRLMIDAIADKHRIDQKRIFATGISNGAIFAHMLAARLSTRIAAIAPVAGGMADPFYEDFKPEEPVSVLILQGTRDRLVRYDGGEVAWGRGETISTDDTVELWVEHNGAQETPTSGAIPDRDPNDGCTATWSSWSQGRNGTEVKLYRLEDGGHTWPGGPQYLSNNVIGRVCRDFDATELIWDFFRQHPKP